MTTTANDSGVETSNDSNDTSMQLAGAAAAGLALPQRFDQRSLIPYIPPSELMMIGGAAWAGAGANASVAAADTANHSNNSSQAGSNSVFPIELDRPAFLPPPPSSQQPSPPSRSLSSSFFTAHCANPPSSTSSTASMSPVFSIPTNTTQTSTTTNTTSISSTHTTNSNSNSIRSLSVPISFFDNYQPTYPSQSMAVVASVSPPQHSHHHQHQHHHNQLKAIRPKSVRMGLGGLQRTTNSVPYIVNLCNERKLRLAASLCNVEVLQRLLDGGVNPNCTDEYQRSALHLAASRGYTDVVIQLLKYGAKPNTKDSLGNTALHLAVCSASSFSFNRVVRILLKHGASVQVKDRHGKTPLDLVQRKLSLMRIRRANDQSSESIKMLLDLSVLTTLLINTCVREEQSNEDMNQLERRLQQLSTTEVESEADALLARVEQLTLQN